MTRLSFLLFMKESDIMAPSRCFGGGRAIRPEPELEVLARMEGRFLGAVGACESLVLAIGSLILNLGNSTMIADLGTQLCAASRDLEYR